MAIHIALLRGVNVGKGRRVPMQTLRTVLERLGHTQVHTLLSSGNAVFRSGGGTPARQAQVIAAALHEQLQLQLQVPVPVIVKAARELDAIVAGNPFADTADDPSRLLVAFTQRPAQLQGLAAVGALVQAPDRFAIGTHAAYLHCPKGLLQSAAGEALLGKACRDVTTRNWATTLKLLSLAQHGSH